MIFMPLWISGFTYSDTGVEVWSFLEVKPAGFGNDPNVGFGGKKKEKEESNHKA